MCKIAAPNASRGIASFMQPTCAMRIVACAPPRRVHVQETPVPCDGAYNYTDEPCYYTSGLVHTVHVTGLEPSTRYTYTVSLSHETLRIVRLPVDPYIPVDPRTRTHTHTHVFS